MDHQPPTPNNNTDKTGLYTDSTDAVGGAEDVTGIYASNTPEDKTGLIDPVGNVQADRSLSGIVSELRPGSAIPLNGKTYTIDAVISRNTGEAVVYKVLGPKKEVLVLKLYKAYKTPLEEPNAEVLQEMIGLKHKHILPLHAYGVGADRYLGKHCFEIAALAQGGDLFSEPSSTGKRKTLESFKAKFTPDFIEKTIVPQLYSGICALHERKIYHCDLKPSNIFFMDARQRHLVIGDYGSAKKYADEAAKELHVTTMVRGTQSYIAPEQLKMVVSTKNDYYSFGLILLHVLYPEQFGKAEDYGEIDPVKHQRYNERLYSNKPLVDFNPAFERLNQLIEGLVKMNPQERFGVQEVSKWLRGEAIVVPDFVERVSRPIKLGDANIQTLQDFVQVLEKRTSWYEELIEDALTSGLVKQWLETTLDRQKRVEYEEIIKYTQPFGKTILKEGLLRFFEPNRPILIGKAKINFNDCQDLNAEILQFFEKLDLIWRTYKISKLKLIFFQFEFSLNQVYQRNADFSVRQIIDTTLERVFARFGIVNTRKSPYNITIPQKVSADNLDPVLNLFYDFNPGRGFRTEDNNFIYSLENIAHYFENNPRSYTNNYIRLDLNRYLDKIGSHGLKNRPLKTFLLEALNRRVSTEVATPEPVDRIESAPPRSPKKRNEPGPPGPPRTTSGGNNTPEGESGGGGEDTGDLYINPYAGQGIALVLLIALSYFTYQLASHQIRVDHLWHLSTSPNYIPFGTAVPVQMETHYSQYYTVRLPSNIRQAGAREAPVLQVIKAGEEVEVLDSTSGAWFKVRLGNQEGYISGKLLTYSRQVETTVPATR